MPTKSHTYVIRYVTGQGATLSILVGMLARGTAVPLTDMLRHCQTTEESEQRHNAAAAGT